MNRKLIAASTALALTLSPVLPAVTAAQTSADQWLLAANEGGAQKKTDRAENKAVQTTDDAQTKATEEVKEEVKSGTDQQNQEAPAAETTTQTTEPAQDQQASEQQAEPAAQATEAQATEAQSTEAQSTETGTTEQQAGQNQTAEQQTEAQPGTEAQATEAAQESAQQGEAQQATQSQDTQAQEAPTTEATSQEATTEEAATDATKTKKQLREERKAARQQEREERKSLQQNQVKPAAAAALEQDQSAGTGTAATTETAPAAVEVTSETVTEETTRTSNEDTAEAEKKQKKKKDKDDDLAKIIGAGAGGLAAGVIIGTLLNDGGEVVENTGDRVVIERDGQYYVRKDENQILRRPGSDVRTETFADGSSRTVVDREDGTRVVTIRDADGYVVHRSRELPDGRTVVLFDDLNNYEQTNQPIEVDTLPAFDPNYARNHQVDYGNTSRSTMREVLEAQPAADLDRSYSLRQVREIAELRDLMPSLDLDVITFDSGSAAIDPSQARKLDDLGFALEEMIARNPDEVFLIEGHTDAVGSRIMNLALSDRRAESVALALTEYYDIPPENLFTQGYGEEYLKVLTEASERANRRATVRRITPLLHRTAARQ